MNFADSTDAAEHCLNGKTYPYVSESYIDSEPALVLPSDRQHLGTLSAHGFVPMHAMPIRNSMRQVAAPPGLAENSSFSRIFKFLNLIRHHSNHADSQRKELDSGSLSRIRSDFKQRIKKFANQFANQFESANQIFSHFGHAIAGISMKPVPVDAAESNSWAATATPHDPRPHNRIGRNSRQPDRKNFFHNAENPLDKEYET